MKLNKNDILEILKKYKFDSKEYIIISSASLVLQDVKKYTTDIDIACSDDLYKILLKEYNCLLEKIDGQYKVWYIDDLINFSVHYYEETEYIELFGYKVQTIESVLNLKKNLNREKDKDDIKLILDFYKNKNKQIYK